MPMLVKTVRGLHNHLAAVVTQVPHKREPILIQGREIQKKRYIHMQNGNLHTHTPTFYFAGSPINKDIRLMQRRET